MTDTKALDALIEAVEKGTLAQRDEDEYAPAVPLPNGDTTNLANVFCAHKGSLDAAEALHEALLPGWGFETGINATFVSIGSVWKSGREKSYIATADSPARALMLAILKAYRAGL